MERGDDAEGSKNPEAHESNNKSPSEEDPENFPLFSDDPKNPEEVILLRSFSDQHVCSTCT